MTVVPQSQMAKASILSVIIAVICFTFAIPGLLVGPFVGLHILIPALYCGALGTGFLYCAAKLPRLARVGRRLALSLAGLTAVSAVAMLIAMDGAAATPALAFPALVLVLSLYVLVLLARMGWCNMTSESN